MGTSVCSVDCRLRFSDRDRQEMFCDAFYRLCVGSDGQLSRENYDDIMGQYLSEGCLGAGFLAQFDGFDREFDRDYVDEISEVLWFCDVDSYLDVFDCGNLRFVHFRVVASTESIFDVPYERAVVHIEREVDSFSRIDDELIDICAWKNRVLKGSVTA